MSLFSRSDDGSIVPSPLPQSSGYVVVVAVGLVFAIGMVFLAKPSYTRILTFTGMIGITRLLKKTLNEDNNNVET